MMKYFEGEEPSAEQLAGLIVQAVAKGTLIPIVCCSAKTGVGLTELLDALVQCALPPTAIVRKATKDGAEIELKADPAGPLVAQVFKTRIDPFVQKLSFIRVYSGTMKKDETVPISGSRKGIKLGPLLGSARRRNEAGRVGLGRRHHRHRQDGRPAHRHVRSASPSCPRFRFPRRWSAWPSRPRAATTKPSSPPRCTRSSRKIRRSSSTAIRRPKSW